MVAKHKHSEKSVTLDFWPGDRVKIKDSEIDGNVKSVDIRYNNVTYEVKYWIADALKTDYFTASELVFVNGNKRIAGFSKEN